MKNEILFMSDSIISINRSEYSLFWEELDFTLRNLESRIWRWK